jgi:hypothetical protein
MNVEIYLHLRECMRLYLFLITSRAELFECTCMHTHARARVCARTRGCAHSVDPTIVGRHQWKASFELFQSVAVAFNWM